MFKKYIKLKKCKTKKNGKFVQDKKNSIKINLV